MTFSIKNWINATLLNETPHNDSVVIIIVAIKPIILSVIILNAIMLSVVAPKWKLAALILYFILRTLVRAVMSDCAVKLSKTLEK